LIVVFLEYAINLVADLFVVQGSLSIMNKNQSIYFINDESLFSGLLIKHT